MINQKIEEYRASQKAEDVATTSENKDNKQKSDDIFLFDNFNFPLTITSFIKEFGKPEQTIIKSPDIPSSTGQLHEWCLSQQNIKLFVLGDSYDSSIDYKAESRFFQISKCVSGKTSNLKGLWDIKLDDSDKQVIDKLTNIARQQKDYTVELKINGPPHLFFLKESKVSHHHILIKKGDYFLYFVINSRGTLESIIKTTFDLSAAG